ncbi:uncharacterized protein [Hemitrygon akajei]|uniref:uncharacterized protein isoform X2 n=1 Tax=Hemitrygon akajei TaxID=2704970 RepID=UPI003BF9CFB1
MEPLPWTLLACLLLTCQVTVLGNRLSGQVGVQQCDRILKDAFPKKMYRSLQSYQTIPSIGSQPEYVEFTTKRGQKFCVNPQKARLMKEYVDSQSRGIAKITQKMPQAGSPTLPKAAGTDPVEEEGRTISSLTTTPLPTVEGQDHSNGSSSTLYIPQSTRLYEEEGTPTSSPSAKPFPGLKEQDPRPPFPQSKPPGPHKEEGVPTLDPPTTQYAGSQEQMEELSLQPMLQDQPVAHGDVPTGQEPTESSGARNTGTSTAETPQDGSKEGGSGGSAHISSPGIAKITQKMPQAGSPTLPKAAGTDPVEEEGRTISSLTTTPLPTVEGQDHSNGSSSTLYIPQSTRLYEEEGTPTSSPSAKPFPGLKEQDPRPPFPQSKPPGPHKEEGVPTLDPPTTQYAGSQEQMEELSLQPMLQDQPVAHGDVPTGQEPTESSGARNTGTSTAETPQDGSKEGGSGGSAHISSPGIAKITQKMPQAGSPTLPKAAGTDPVEEEGRTISSLTTTPFPTMEGQDHSNGSSSTLSIPQSTRLYEEEGTPTSSPSAKPFPGLKEQDPRPPFPQSKPTGPHKEEGVPTLDPPTTQYAGSQEQMEERPLQPMHQDQPVAHGDVPIGQEPTESSGARDTGTSTAETPQDGSKEDGGGSTVHISSPGPTRGGSGLRPDEGEVDLRVHPNWGSSKKRHGGSGETGRSKSPLFVFLGLLALLVFLTILGVFAHTNSRQTRTLQAAQIQMVHYSRVTSNSDDIV